MHHIADVIGEIRQTWPWDVPQGNGDFSLPDGVGLCDGAAMKHTPEDLERAARAFFSLALRAQAILEGIRS